MTYTRKQIMTMDAEQLAEATAVHVMGWTKRTSKDGAREFWDNGVFCGGRWVEPDGSWEYGKSSHNVWNPAESISTAWEVAEKFPIVDILRVEIFEGNYYHVVKIYTLDNGMDPLRVECKTAPEAICKAALLAVFDL